MERDPLNIEKMLDEEQAKISQQRADREQRVNDENALGSRAERDRDHERNGHGRNRNDDAHYRGPYRRTRESDSEARGSRERDYQEGNRARSSKGADSDDEEARVRDFRDERRGWHGYRDRGARGDRRGGDFYSGNGRGGRRTRSRSPARDDTRRRDRSRDRGARRRSPSPEAAEGDKDKRTVFVQQIAARAESRHLRDFFSKVGAVTDAQIVKDRISGRSKGVGYVEFREEASVQKALELTGQQLKGIPIIVQLTEAEKNRASRTTAEPNSAAANGGAPFHRLYVGNIHFSVTETDLRDIFSPYGPLEQVTLQRDEQVPTRSKGYGFVQYVEPEDAKRALSELNDFELAGRRIRVGLGNDKFTPESTATLLRQFPQHAASYQGSAFSGAGGRGAYAGGSGGSYDRVHGRDERGGGNASALDDSDMSGVNFKSVDRNKLMANLARNEVELPTAPSMPPALVRALAVNKPAPSKCIKVENAFDPQTELANQGPDWIKVLEKEVRDECDAKYGKVVHLAVDPNSEGDIYVKFSSVTGGEKAMQGLNGRRFAGRPLRASYVVDKIYNSLYGAAAEKF